MTVSCFWGVVPLFFALGEACAILEEEGLENRIKRHERMASSIRAAVAAWGLDLFPKIDSLHRYSNTATAISVPPGVKDSDLRGIIKKMGIEIAGGQDELKGRIFRIGTMGAVGAPEILATLAATQFALRKLGCRVNGDGVQAACEVLG